MKKIIFASILLSLSLPELSWTQTSSDQFDQKFISKFHFYIQEADLKVRLKNVEFPLNISSDLSLRLEACRLKDKRVPKLASWPEIVSWITVQDEDCTGITSVNVRRDKWQDIEMNVPIKRLLNSWKKMDINHEGTYLKVGLYSKVDSTHKHQVRQIIGTSRIESYPLLTELLLHKATIDVTPDKIGDTALGLELKLIYRGAQDYPVKNLLQKNIPHPLFLVDSMSQDPELKKLFYSDAGVWEGYTIKEHTLRVIELMNDQYYCQISSAFEKKMSEKLKMPLKNFMLLTMALHDIGKPLAVEAGDKSQQHSFTRPVMKRALSRVGLAEATSTIALELTDNDVIGDYLKGSIDLSEAISELKNQINKTGLTNEEYFRLQLLFYTADAGSYPGLFTRVFKEDSQTKCITPRASKFSILESNFLDASN